MKNLDKWSVIESYYELYSPVQQQINSFNQFIDEKISEIVEENGFISSTNNVDVTLSNGEVTIKKE